MDFSYGIQSLKNKSILVTGATGFLGKVLVEKILRIQPDIKKLYILIRVKNDKPPLERLYDEIISKDLFNVLREEHGVNFDDFISRKVTPVAGDTALHDLGIQDCSVKEEVLNEIAVVVHQAATTRLDERYDTALDINTYGAKNVINFAKKCTKLKILIHVSTAYVCGEGKGLVQEIRYKMGETLNGVSGLDIDAERKLAQNTLLDLQKKGTSARVIRKAMKDLGLQRARAYGWPNTYVFSKALGEMFMDELRENLHVVIIRPTMICSTVRDPFPGWIEGHGHIVLMCEGYAKGYFSFVQGGKEFAVDLIPVDMVVNAIVVTMVARVENPCIAIYQVGSSLRNPVDQAKVTDLHYQYFSKKPWIDEKGVFERPTKVLMTNSRLIFMIFCAIHIFSLLGLAIVDILSCHFYKVNYRLMMIQLACAITFSSKLYRTYSCFSGIFDDQNSENLRAGIRKSEVDLDGFGFDPKTIEWDDYILNVHIPGVLKYCFPNGRHFGRY